MTVPVVVVIGLLIGGASNAGDKATPHASATVLPAVSVPAPAASDARTVATCAQVISALPLRLAGQDLRRTESTPATSSVVAWGDPAIVLRCGVTRPAALSPSLADQLFQINQSVTVLPRKDADATTFTVVDRAVYLDLTVPSSYRQPPLGPVADAIAKVLPDQVCSTDPATPNPADLCTRRK